MSKSEEEESYLVKQLKGTETEKINALDFISSSVLENPESLDDLLTIRELCLAIVEMLEINNSERLLIATLSCVVSLLTTIFTFSIHLIQFGILPKANLQLKKTESVEVASLCIRIISFYSLDSPVLVGALFDINPIQRFFKDLSPIDQRDVVTMLTRVITNSPFGDYSDLLHFSLELTQHDDAKIRSMSTQILLHISERFDPKKFPHDIYNEMLLILNSTTDFQLFSTIIQILNTVVVNSKGKYSPIDRLPGFEKGLFSEKDSNYELNILKIIHTLIPDPNLPSSLWNKKDTHITITKELVNDLQPILLRYFIEKNDNKTICLQNIAACASIYPIRPSFSFLNALLRFCSNQNHDIQYALAVAVNMDPKSFVARSGLLHFFQKAKFSKSCADWCKKSLALLNRNCQQYLRTVPPEILKSDSLKTIVKYIHKEKLFPFEFFQSKLLDQYLNIFHSLENSNKDIDLSENEIQTLNVLGNGSLDFIDFPEVNIITNFETVSNQTVTFIANGPDKSHSEINVPILASFLMIEGWYNMKTMDDPSKALKDQMNKNHHLKHLFEFEKDNLRSQTKFAILNRAFETPEYKKCSFEIDGEIYSAFDNIIIVMSKDPEKLTEILDGGCELNIIEHESPRYPQMDFNFLTDYKYDSIFTFLKFIFKFSSKSFLRNEQLTSSIFSDLADPLQTMTIFSPSVRFMYSMPFLFNFEQRSFLFQSTALDSFTSAATIHDKFNSNDNSKAKSTFTSIRCTLARKHLYKDGCKALEHFGQGPFRLEFAFKGENGIGEGPTQEFFTLMSRELCKRRSSEKRKLWRDNELEQSEYISNKMGLFPAVDANPRMLKILGLLCGKAIFVGKMIDIPFNPSFFDLLIGREVPLSKIDPVLSKSLSCKEGLYDLPFVYPGTEVPLKSNGSDILVDENNVDEYISLVEDFTCGKKMMLRLQPFIDAFQTNVRMKALSLLDSNEIMTMLCGDEVKITEKELLQFVKIEHGYEKNDVQIKNLFKIIGEMDKKDQKLLIKFITGCNRLPYGGISSLSPPLTVAKRVDNDYEPDECLPTVMTCTNYFKLPPYSSIEIMKEKIEKAIFECQDAFELS